MKRVNLARAGATVAMALLACACATTPRPEPEPERADAEPGMEQEMEPVALAESAEAQEPESTPPEADPEPVPEPEPELAAESQPEAPARQVPAEPEATAEQPSKFEEPKAPVNEQTAEPADTPDEPKMTEPAGTTASEASRSTMNRQITGRVEILRNGREQRFSATYLEQTVVAWRPADSSEAAPMEERQIVTRRKRFYPQTMVVTSGTRVRFPNLDDIQHNVFSITPGHRFDVGVYGPDDGAATVFEGVGTVDVYCDIHPNMAAFLLVLDTPHFTTPDEEGQFRLENLPPGPGELLVWNYRAEQRITRRELADSNRLGETLDLTVNITRPSVPQHTTKTGRPYNAPGD